MEIRGVAHYPAPPGGGRNHSADLSSAEISATNIAGLPLLREHDTNERIGTCLASWKGRNGELRIAAKVNDPLAQQEIRSGKMRGLSLGTDLIMDENSDVLYRKQSELSVCEEGKRDGTWIDTVNGRPVHRTMRASKTQRDSYTGVYLL